MNKYPFKFLNSYDKDDTDIYFGRDEEIEALYEMVFQANSLLVYGASGTGKTSLIQCGLAGRFKSYDWLPLMVRRGTNMNDSLVKVLTEAGGNIEGVDFGQEDNLTGLSKLIRNVYLNHFKPIYLIFDQFEEVFILSNDKKEERQFIKAVKELLLCEQPVKLIFSIREEYLGYLYEFERAIPQLFKKKLRVEAMGINKLNEFLNGINTNKELIVSIKEDEVAAIADAIFSKLTGKHNSPNIQLPYLQVFLDKLYWEISKDDSHQKEVIITLEHLKGMGDIGDVLTDFLENQVGKISKAKQAAFSDVSAETIWKILSEFATLEGTKKPIYIKKGESLEIDLDKELIRECIEDFNTGRILKVLNTSDEGDSYELAHDSLAKCIAEMRSGEEKGLLETKMLIRNQVFANDPFSQNLLNRIEHVLPKIKLTPEEDKLIKDSRRAIEKQKNAKRRRLQITIAGMAIALVVMIGLSIWAVIQKRNAEVSEKAAKENQKRAQQNLIVSVTSEIKRIEREIAINTINRASFNDFGANDVRDTVNLRIERYENLKKVLEDSIIKLSNSIDFNKNK